MSNTVLDILNKILLATVSCLAVMLFRTKGELKELNQKWEARICEMGYGTMTSGTFQFRSLDSVVISASFPPSIHLLAPDPETPIEEYKVAPNGGLQPEHKRKLTAKKEVVR